MFLEPISSLPWWSHAEPLSVLMTWLAWALQRLSTGELRDLLGLLLLHPLYSVLSTAGFPRQPQERGLHGTLVYLLLLRPHPGLQHLAGRGQREGSPEAQQQTSPPDGLEQEKRTLQQSLNAQPLPPSFLLPPPHPTPASSPRIHAPISTSILLLGHLIFLLNYLLPCLREGECSVPSNHTSPRVPLSQAAHSYPFLGHHWDLLLSQNGVGPGRWLPSFTTLHGDQGTLAATACWVG